MTPCLVVKGLSKSFGDLKAVDAVSFAVDEHEVFGIVGPNGAGKTTLFNSITGLPFRADAGVVEFLGVDISQMAPREIFRRGLARTFQRESVFESLTVEESLWVGGIYGTRRMRGRALRAMAVRVAERLGLTESIKAISRDMPLFEKKKLMIGTALMGEPRLLMLDEPVAGLNPSEADSIADLISGLRDDGITVVVIEHVLPVLFRVSDRVLAMDAGASIAIGPPAEIRVNAEVIRAYLGDSAESLGDAAGG